MTQPGDAESSAGSVEAEEAAVPLTVARDALRSFSRALKAYQLYLPNNPMHARATEAAVAAFAELWRYTDELVVDVSETEFRSLGQSLVIDLDKSSESLSWTFFKDGIRELTIRQGFEESEMRTLLELLQTARTAPPDGDDLLTLLSDQEFATFRYRFFESASGEFAVDAIEAGLPVERFEQRPESAERERFEDLGGEESTDEAAAAGAAAGIVRMEDFDPTLYFLDQSEIEYLRTRIAREFSTDLRPNVIAALLDTFEHETSTAIRDEIIADLESLLILLLSGSHLRDVTYLLREGERTLLRAPQLSEAHRHWLESLPDRLSQEAVLRQLFEAMETMPLELPPGDVYELFALLPPAALAPIFEHLARTANPELRRLLEGAAERISRSHTSEVVRLIESQNMAVAAGAIARAAALKWAAAVPVLSQVLVHALAQSLRIGALNALSEIGSPDALDALEKAVGDDDREIRVAAARAVASRGYHAALPQIERAIRSRTLRDSNLTEKIAFFETFGTLAGDSGVDLLDEILNGKIRLGRRPDPELRACAAAGLAKITSRRSREALQRASVDKEAVIRNAVRRALREDGQ